MPSLQISALGSPEIRLNNTRVVVKPKKALALLIYLAAAERAQSRDTLATLLWPESGQRHARAALRRRLSELTHTIGEAWLETDGELLRLVSDRDVLFDVSRFEALLEECGGHGHDKDAVCSACREPLETAARLYRDDFLAGFTLPDCPEFDDWQFFQAETHRQAFATVLERLVMLHRGEREPAQAIPYARRWIALDPLHEPAHRALMCVYADAGQRSAALRQYELCAQTLDAELGAPPDAQTTKLHERIHTQSGAEPSAPQSEGTDRIVGPRLENDGATKVSVAPDEVRMVTILALDLDAADETEWERRPEDVAGRIKKTLADAQSMLRNQNAFVVHTYDSGLLAAFGLPSLHEDDAERALHVALGLRDAASAEKLSASIGVDSGMVYVTPSASDGSLSVAGPTVRSAVTLAGQTSRGAVLAGRQTYHQTELAFRFESHRPRDSRSRQSPIAYEVLRSRRHPVKSRGIPDLCAPLIGRDEELAQLQSALGQALAGRGQLATVVGEAGLGKSRLVAELKASLAGTGPDVIWLEGRCLEMTQAVPYWPFVDILQTSFGWMPQVQEAERARQVTGTLDALCEEERLTDEQIEIMGPILGRLLSLRFGNEWDDRLRNARPNQIQHQTFQALRDYAIAMAQRRPLVMVLEDLHWADAPSLELVGYLLDSLADVPIMLLCVYRPESALEQDRLAVLASRKCPAAHTEIRLRELTPDHSRSLVEALLHVEGIAQPTKTRILDACQGNPFFLEEVVHDLIEAGLIFRDGDVWRAKQEVETTPVPSRVQSVILARYDRLDPAQKLVLQTASVIGRLFSKQLLETVLVGENELNQVLDELSGRAFIYAERTVPELVYSFRHALMQEAVYRTIPGQRRAALHERVASALEDQYAQNLDEVVDQIAYHYDRSNVDDKAVEYLLRAGDKAARAYSTTEAVAYYRRVLKRTAELDADARSARRRFHALGEMGKTLMRSSQYDEAEKYLRQAIAYGKEQALPVKEVVRLHWWLGDLLMNWNVRYEETLQTGLDGLAMLPKEQSESAEAAMMLGIIAYGHFFLGNENRFHRTAARLARQLPELPYKEEFRVCYGCIIESCFFRRDLEGVAHWTGQMGERVRRHQDQWAAAGNCENEAYNCNYFMGDPISALALLQTAFELYQRVGDGRRANWAEVDVGEILDDLGDSAQAEQVYRTALPAVRELNAERLVDVLLRLASVCMAQRKWDEARNILLEALQEMTRIEENPSEALVLLGFISLSCADRSDAEKRFAEALHALDDPDCVPQERRKWRLMTHSFFANALYGMETSLVDAQSFCEFCSDFRAQHPVTELAVFQHWHLTSAKPAILPDADVVNDRFANALGSEWDWVDPNGGGTFEVQNGLTVWSPAVRDLWYPLVNAPRIVRPVVGDFAAQVTCAPASEDRPGIGGLLLWQDVHSYLHFCIGVRAQDEMSLEGCIENKDVTIGRGQLIGEPVTLRMERIGDKMRALCTADDDTWHLVGEVDFAPAEDEQIGLVAIGFPDRTIYQASYPDGTTIRFTDFRLWNV